MRFWHDKADGAARAITVTVTSQAELLRDLDARLAGGAGFAVATLNLDHVVKLRRNAAFRTAYLEQSHVTADGNPIVWLLRLARQPAELVTGSDLVEPVAELAARRNAGIAMIGSSEGSLAKAAEAMVQRHPGLSVLAAISPPMGFDPEGPEADAAIERIGQSGARICFVALGAPKQEIFAARARRCLPSVGFLSVGAGLDFLSGTQHRAPWIVRRFAAEWLWRLLNDPRRLAGRYAACATSLPGLAALALRARADGGKIR
jgi:exopolysaccharide biosynthesis WecB/TagA/CpsF family protein